jgi:hypothetical protein
MDGTKQLYGGLGFASGSDLRLQKIRQTVEFSLKKRGLEAEIGVDLVARKVQFIADECSITLEFSEPLSGASKNHPHVNIGAENRAKAGPENTALHVEITLSDCLNDDPKTLLAFLMIDLIRAHYPVCVEWLKPTAQLRAEDFLSIFDIDLTGHVVSPRRAVRRKSAGRFAAVQAAVRASQTGATPAGYLNAPQTKGLGWPDAQVALTEAYRLPLPSERSVRAGGKASVLFRLSAGFGSAFALVLSLFLTMRQAVITLFRREYFMPKH